MEKFIFFFSSSGMWNTAFEGRKRRKENEWERRGGDEGRGGLILQEPRDWERQPPGHLRFTIGN